MKKIVSVMLAVMMLLSLASVSVAEDNIQKTLTIGVAQDINNLNLQMQNDQINNNCISLSHEGLVMLRNDAVESGCTYDPVLAESYEWEDDHTLVFHLHEGITFCDGTPCTAEDCVFTIEMGKDPSTAVCNNLGQVESVEARDPLTFVVHASEYSNELLSNFASKSLCIQSKAAYESGMDKPYYIGTGPYKFAEWVEGQYVRYVRNENYWDPANAGKAEEIIFKPILEATSRVIALQNGEIDVCIDPPTTELQFLESDPNIEVYEKEGTRLFYFGFNCSKAPFDNKTLRQAVSCAIDKDTILQVVLGGKGKTQNTVVNRGVWSFYDEPDLGAYTYDPERAKALLAEAGYQPGELTVDFYAATDDPYKTIAPIVQANLMAIGINANIVPLDQATLKAECQKGNHQIFLWRWNVIDRLGEIYNELFTTPYASNYHHYSDAYVDELANKILVEMDQDVRYQDSLAMQKYLADACPQVPLYVANLVIAWRTGLTGHYLFGGGNHVWSHAYVDLSAK